MPSIAALHTYLSTSSGQQFLSLLYGAAPESVAKQQARYDALLDTFEAAFPMRADVEVFSAPGRTEVGGNHTDHNAGRVLAAAVHLDVLAVAARNSDPVIRIESQGYPTAVVDLATLSPQPGEVGTSMALIRGVAARFKDLGYAIGGFDACLSGAVPKGSGLSSSASYEVLIGTILSHLYNQGDLQPLLIAQIGQYAENYFFGKPCGLMDQTSSAVGGFVTIDFADAARPVVEKVDFDFAASGYSVVIVDTGGTHADLTDEYAAVASEMRAVARLLGGQVLRDAPFDQVLACLPAVRAQLGDRAALRALHFYAENQRVLDQVSALQTKDFPRFLRLVIESGRSSFMWLQNGYVARNPSEQGVSLGLALSERLLQSPGSAGEPAGAWRVHGGGFAGTIQAFVPNPRVPEYMAQMETVFGEGCCYPLHIRPLGAVKLNLERTDHGQ